MNHFIYTLIPIHILHAHPYYRCIFDIRSFIIHIFIFYDSIYYASIVILMLYAVNQLRPGNIKVVMAMGDSITAAMSAKDTLIFSLKEYPLFHFTYNYSIDDIQVPWYCLFHWRRFWNHHCP